MVRACVRVCDGVVKHADLIHEGGGVGGVGSGTLVGYFVWFENKNATQSSPRGPGWCVLVFIKQQGWRRFILKVQVAVSWTSGSDDIQTVLHL